jgi:hypothetical protein
VIVAAHKVFIPSPFVFERQELIKIRPAVDHSFLIYCYSTAAGRHGTQLNLILELLVYHRMFSFAVT